MIINIDHKPLKYGLLGNFTIAQRGSSSVTVEGVNDKTCIRGTFGVSFIGNFLSIQLIYAEKTV